MIYEILIVFTSTYKSNSMKENFIKLKGIQVRFFFKTYISL